MTSDRYDIIFMEMKKTLDFSGLSFVTEGSGGSVYFSNCKNQDVLKSHFLIDQASLQCYILKKFVDSSTHLQLGRLWLGAGGFQILLNCQDFFKKLENLTV